LELGLEFEVHRWPLGGIIKTEWAQSINYSIWAIYIGGPFDFFGSKVVQELRMYRFAGKM
jgi:hypothetical protein